MNDETRAHDDETVPTPTDGDVGFRYQDCRIQAREIGGDASRLARLVGGTRGMALFCAARGDSNREACDHLPGNGRGGGPRRGSMVKVIEIRPADDGPA